MIFLAEKSKILTVEVVEQKSNGADVAVIAPLTRWLCSRTVDVDQELQRVPAGQARPS